MNNAPPELIQEAKEMMAKECERRGYKEAAAYYRGNGCPDDQTDITVITLALAQARFAAGNANG